MSFNFGNYNNSGNNGYAGNQNFVSHLYNFIGQTVTVFTTSGGPSGCGFSGVLLSVNCNFLRLSTQIGTPPSNPLSETICGDFGNCNNNGGSRGAGDGYGNGNGNGNNGSGCRHNGYNNNVGSVVDIPLDRIAAFCHNAV